jgi:hypothetical protein
MKQILNRAGLVLFTSFIYAGPPMMSDDPFTPKVGELEVNFASEMENGTDLTLVMPIVDINYGIYPHTQLTIETAYASSNGHNNSNGVEVAIKYNFYRSDTLNIAIYPKYLFYPISTPFDEGKSYELQIPISLKLNDHIEWVTSLSYLYPQNEANHYEIGSYLAYEHKKQTYFLETYIEEHPQDNHMATFFNLGYFYQYQENLGIMGSIGYETISLKKEAEVAYIALQVIF